MEKQHNINVQVSFIFSHPDFNCRLWTLTRSAICKTHIGHGLEVAPLLTVGREFHPAPKMNRYVIFFV